MAIYTHIKVFMRHDAPYRGTGAGPGAIVFRCALPRPTANAIRHLPNVADVRGRCIPTRLAPVHGVTVAGGGGSPRSPCASLEKNFALCGGRRGLCPSAPLPFEKWRHAFAGCHRENFIVHDFGRMDFFTSPRLREHCSRNLGLPPRRLRRFCALPCALRKKIAV